MAAEAVATNEWVGLREEGEEGKLHHAYNPYLEITTCIPLWLATDAAAG